MGYTALWNGVVYRRFRDFFFLVRKGVAQLGKRKTKIKKAQYALFLFGLTVQDLAG